MSNLKRYYFNWQGMRLDRAQCDNQHGEWVKFKDIKELFRQAVADYMSSEGCECCEDVPEHGKHKKRLAELLDVPVFTDENGSGYDFQVY